MHFLIKIENKKRQPSMRKVWLFSFDRLVDLLPLEPWHKTYTVLSVLFSGYLHIEILHRIGILRRKEVSARISAAGRTLSVGER